ncbi:helix-turn-helix domain-containing protein [Alcanivorax quisquiliarum]|uniref:Helix-turn-helix domain-containing protein n=1 Tax=Alcanivorax quisquiliarum TaxID=2933565 RepID=A0ABT0E4K3_9GAMM|nr:helix-turn-helix transcriptional regulator [Alcanivorax quisquiliarum]MCK0536749.1 helix-turn-helix domain-containing protein [Alcanivorax quisquiliarum]
MRMVRGRVYSHNSTMKIGAVLKLRRDERGETLEEVAYRAGTDASNLSRIERGTQQPSVGLLEALARALETRVSELYLEVERTQHLPTPPHNRSTGELARLQRHIKELTPANRQLVVEFCKLLKRLQRTSEASED